MMKRITIFTLLISTMACAQIEKEKEEPKQVVKKETQEPHRYGGWYCPDNLNGFPPVDIDNWSKVPVIEGRLPTLEEARSEASLIHIDKEKYPNAKALDIKLPQLATFYNRSSEKDETIIVIQAVNVQDDSIVGFRYLNGGNGSARLSEVNFLESKAIAKIPTSHFVSHSINIKAKPEEIWKVLTDEKHLNSLSPTFKGNAPKNTDWRSKSTINYYYASPKDITNSYADILYGSYYIQNDYLINDNAYVEKFILLENKEENYTELKIVCGPYFNDFGFQKAILEHWAKKVNELSN